MLPVSAVTGQGLERLEAELVRLADAHQTPPEPDRPARLPIDRSFLLKGLGAVVTGTLAGGRITTGDTLELLPSGRRVRIRSVQVHGEDREHADRGERTALRVSGAELTELERGAQLVTPGSIQPTRSLEAELRLLPDAPKALTGSTAVRFHLLSGEVPARIRPLGREAIEPGASGAVELRLAAPLAAVRDDRFIVRRLSPQTTLGGGRILDPHWSRRRGAELGAAVDALGADEDSALIEWVRQAGEGGAEAGALAGRLGEEVAATESRLEALVRDPQAARGAGGQRPRQALAPHPGLPAGGAPRQGGSRGVLRPRPPGPRACPRPRPFDESCPAAPRSSATSTSRGCLARRSSRSKATS